MNIEKLEKANNLDTKIRNLENGLDTLSNITNIKNMFITHDSDLNKQYELSRIEILLEDYQMIKILEYIKDNYNEKINKLKKEFQEL